MLESDLLCPTRIISQLRDESGDEELSVLPRHTKVIVTGNNRTKSVLLGLQGVVKKAVGLGGWHWLVLKNGIEVKLQRNALSVLEHPTGNEVDEDIDFDGSSGSDGEKDQDFSSGSEVLKPRKPRVPSMKPVIEPAATKYPIHSSYKDIQSSSINVSKPVRDPKKADLVHRLGYISACIRDLDLKIGIAFPYLGFRPQKVDLAKLGTKSLWRYCSHYNIVGIHHHSSREQMLNAVQRHFALQQPMDEIQVLAEFAQALKRLKCNTERVRIPNINNPNL